jgi:hypothetical protein
MNPLELMMQAALARSQRPAQAPGGTDMRSLMNGVGMLRQQTGAGLTPQELQAFQDQQLRSQTGAGVTQEELLRNQNLRDRATAGRRGVPPAPIPEGGPGFADGPDVKLSEADIAHIEETLRRGGASLPRYQPGYAEWETPQDLFKFPDNLPTQRLPPLPPSIMGRNPPPWALQPGDNSIRYQQGWNPRDLGDEPFWQGI